MKIQLIFTSDGLLKLVYPKYSSCVMYVNYQVCSKCLDVHLLRHLGQLGIPQCSPATVAAMADSVYFTESKCSFTAGGSCL